MEHNLLFFVVVVVAYLNLKTIRQTTERRRRIEKGCLLEPEDHEVDDREEEEDREGCLLEPEDHEVEDREEEEDREGLLTGT